MLDALTDATLRNIGYREMFVPDRFIGDLLFFEATRRPDGEAPDPGAWRPYVTGDVERFEVDCRHAEMMNDRTAAMVAALVSGRLS